MLCGLRKDHGARTAAIHTAVIFIEHELFRTVEHGFPSGDLPELANDAGVHKAQAFLMALIVILVGRLGVASLREPGTCRSVSNSPSNLTGRLESCNPTKSSSTLLLLTRHLAARQGSSLSMSLWC